MTTRYLITATDVDGHSLSLAPADQLNDAESCVFVDSPQAMLAYVAEPRTAYWFDASGDDGWIASEVAVYEARPDCGDGRRFHDVAEIHPVVRASVQAAAEPEPAKTVTARQAIPGTVITMVSTVQGLLGDGPWVGRREVVRWEPYGDGLARLIVRRNARKPEEHGGLYPADHQFYLWPHVDPALTERLGLFHQEA